MKSLQCFPKTAIAHARGGGGGGPPPPPPPPAPPLRELRAIAVLGTHCGDCIADGEGGVWLGRRWLVGGLWRVILVAATAERPLAVAS